MNFKFSRFEFQILTPRLFNIYLRFFDSTESLGKYKLNADEAKLVVKWNYGCKF